MRNGSDFREEIKRGIHQYLDIRRQSEARERRRLRRKRIALIILALLLMMGPLLILKGYMLYQDIARQRVAMQFIHAVENRDGKALCQLATPWNHQKFDLTPEKAQAALNALFRGLGTLKVMRVRKSPPRPNQANPDERFWRVYWGDSATDVLLPDKMGDDGFYSLIAVRSTSQGFRVDFGVFLLATAESRWGYESSNRAVKNIRKATGL